MNTIKATQEYRSQLQKSLERVRLKVHPREFPIVAAGILSEIDRLDREMVDVQFKALMGCNDSMPVFPRIAQIVQRTYARLEIAETSSVSQDKQHVVEIPLTSQRTPRLMTLKTPTISMGADVAWSA
jgi:hypothetical protein